MAGDLLIGVEGKDLLLSVLVLNSLHGTSKPLEFPIGYECLAIHKPLHHIGVCANKGAYYGSIVSLGWKMAMQKD